MCNNFANFIKSVATIIPWNFLPRHQISFTRNITRNFALNVLKISH